MNKKLKILMPGGGTGGPVAPLIAVAEEIKHFNPAAEFLFVGTKTGPEKEIIEKAGFRFQTIPAAKLRRYFSLRNFIDVFVFMAGLNQARKIINDYKPDLIFSAGGFVAVPIIWIARLKKIKIIIHQQDAKVGLANKMSGPFADIITTAFSETVKEFYSHSGLFKHEKTKRIEWVGNPVRKEFFTKELPDKQFFNLKDDLPVLLIFGGGTGAKQINEVVAKAIPDLVKSHQVVHITGQGKKDPRFQNPNYHVYDFLPTQMPTIMKMADIVICRAGLSTMAELSVLGKVAIVVPMPKSHQEENAQVLKDRSAAVVLDKTEFNPENLERVVTTLKFNVVRQKLLSENISKLMPHDAQTRLAKIILE